MQLFCIRLTPDAQLPTYAHPNDAGADLYASADAVIPANGGVANVSTGLQMAIDSGFEGQIRPRSGLAKKHHVTVLNAPGTVDAGYRGEVGVLLINHGHAPYHVVKGDRIAQLVICPVSRPTIHEADALPATTRGAGGFGSTGA